MASVHRHNATVHGEIATFQRENKVVFPRFFYIKCNKMN